MRSALPQNQENLFVVKNQGLEINKGHHTVFPAIVTNFKTHRKEQRKRRETSYLQETHIYKYLQSKDNSFFNQIRITRRLKMIYGSRGKYNGILF